MAKSRFRLNDTLSAASYVTSEGDLCKILVGDTAPSMTASSWEGSNAIIAPQSGSRVLLKNTDNSALTNGTYFLDYMVFIPTATTMAVRLASCINDTASQYSWVDVLGTSGGGYTSEISSYDDPNGVLLRAQTGTRSTIGRWCRVRVEMRAKGIYGVSMWVGATDEPSNTNGGNENITATDSSSWNLDASGYSNWLLATPWGGDATGATGRIDDIVISDTALSQPRLSASTIAGTPVGTATGTAAATATRVLAGTPSITASAAANAGLVIPTAAASSITATGSVDAAVITTHDAEASSIITASSTAATTMTRPLNAAATVTASAVAAMANQTAADGVVQALGVARIVIDGETSPGFLYSTVAKNVLTS